MSALNSSHPAARRARWLVLGATLLWSGLCAALHWAGHVPSGPTPVAGWYGVQAILLWVVLPLQCWLVGRIVGRVTALTEAGRLIGAEALATTVLCFVLSDIVAWMAVGFAELGLVLRWTAPAALLVGLGRGVHQLRARSVGLGRALGGLLLGFLVAAVVGGPFLR